jgi:hypothetical protein
VKYGEEARTAKMTREIVADCRRRYRAGEVTQLELCVQYGISSASMSQAIHGVTWAHVTDPPPVPRDRDGRAVYGRTERARQQRRAQAAATNRLRWGRPA